MTDAPVTIASPADMSRAAIQKRADDATAQLNQLTADYRNSPAYKAEQLRAELRQLDLDPSFLGKETAGSHGAQSHRAALREQLRVAEAEAETHVKEAFSEERRIELALAGQVDHVGVETTIDGQVPSRDFAGAIGYDVELGIRSNLIKSFYGQGQSDDKFGHKAAEVWLPSTSPIPRCRSFMLLAIA